MNLLLDTHFLVWVALGLDFVPPAARGLMSDAGSTLVFSSASIWELAIKYSRGPSGTVPDPFALKRFLLERGYVELPVSSEHALRVVALPPIHKDPFDRILVAQALAEDMELLTVDAKVATYPGRIRKY